MDAVIIRGVITLTRMDKFIIFILCFPHFTMRLINLFLFPHPTKKAPFGAYVGASEGNLLASYVSQ